jgi:Na+/H+ antiporter NhaD/arsenite permease-like protein
MNFQVVVLFREVMFMKKAFRIILAAVALLCMSAPSVFADEAAHEAVNEALPMWSIIPFVGMLLSIAIIPLIKPEWWDRNMLWVALAWSALFIIPFAIAYGAGEAWYRLLESVLLDFVPFIVLLFGLFVVAGGIAIKGTIAGTTKTNVIMLLIGTFLASWIGTTGAAMLMIRPVIRANAWREKKAHIVVFFIFLVANMGGCLTPLGDPPLFMGFQRGVPFLWTTTHLLPILIFNVVILMIVFILIDRHYCKKEYAAGRSPEDMMDPDAPKEKISIEGGHNIIFIGMIILGVILSGVLPFEEGSGIRVFDDCVFPWGSLVECVIILLAAFLSLKTTKKSTREINEFTYGPIAEVAKLFIGIFITMIPALAILEVHGASLGLTHPAQMFWATGMLSSFLDNTPTYLVFLQVAGALGETAGVSTSVGMIEVKMLEAISAGAVFMGANTYIGNAPNFMVKSIAEENKIKMPSFFGYMGWSFAILIPTFIIDTLVFFL